MILLIDNYDSFTYNLYQYIGEINSDIKVVRNDKITLDEIRELAPEKIVLSPGPKSPNEAGICVDLIKEFYKEIPILGICLGHQSIGQAFGAKVVHAKAIYHGKYSMIKHNGTSIFKDVSSPTKVARYHSLAVEEKGLKEFEILSKTEDGEIMAMVHKKFPLFGLQFHPESIYTPEGMTMVRNFLKL